MSEAFLNNNKAMHDLIEYGVESAPSRLIHKWARGRIYTYENLDLQL